MKRRILLTILISCAAVCMLAFAGCFDLGNNNNEEKEPVFYTIMYNDGTQNCSIQVSEGSLYTIPVPQKQGYTFTGLFNSREGGVQYVDEYGSCLAPFSGNSNMVLYAQFEAKTYTVAFDYGKAGGTPYTCTVA